MKVRTTFVAALVAVGLGGAFAACGDDTGKVTTDTTLDTSFSDVDVPDATTDTTQDTSNPNAVRRLMFLDTVGDDQIACTGRCTYSISFNSDRDLEVVYTEDGQPVAGQVVKFELIDDNDPKVGFINALSSVTDGQGVAQIQTRSTGTIVGQYVVKAFIDKSEVPPLFFDVVVTAKGQVPLTVLGEYSGSRPVGAYTVKLYRQNAAGAPKCDANFSQEVATTGRDNILFGQTAKFPEFDDLEVDLQQMFTIVAESKNEDGIVQARGCNDTDGLVKFTVPTTVTVEMLDLPPTYKGVYSVKTILDFVSAIPEPYGTWVGYLVDFFRDPIQTLFEIVCEQIIGGPDDLGDFCGFLFSECTDGQGNPDVCPTTVGEFAFNLLDTILTGLLSNSDFGQVLTSGAEIGDVLRAFEIRGTIELASEPVDGEWALGEGSQKWQSIKLKWSLGLDCDPQLDTGCGDRQLSWPGGAPAAGLFSASVANDYELTIDPHSITLNWGAVIDQVITGFVLPQFVHPQVNSYQKLLEYLVGGDARPDCLAPGPDGITCCEAFADNIGNEDGTSAGNVGGGFNESTFAGICQTVTVQLDSFLDGYLSNAGVSSGNTFMMGTKVSCLMSDDDSDLIIDRLGSASAPCIWDARLSIGSGSSNFDATFFGTRAE